MATSFPDDIFTEPGDVDPDTLANLGPLRRLAGSWGSASGKDVNPKADGPERRDFVERIVFEPIDPQANGPQLLYGLRYHVHINTEEEDTTFHDQIGYWLWEPATGLIQDARFKTYGCGSAIASSSLVTEWVKGKSLDEALTIKNTHIAEELALPPVKIHCSILAEDAIKAAVDDYRSRHEAAASAAAESAQAN